MGPVMVQTVVRRGGRAGGLPSSNDYRARNTFTR